MKPYTIIAMLILVTILLMATFLLSQLYTREVEELNAQLTETTKTLRFDYDRLKAAYSIVTSELEICQTK